MLKLIYIGMGGFLGAGCRYLMTKWIEMRWKTLFPTGTLIVNIVGSFLLGFLMILFIEKTAGYSNLKILMTTGFLGAFTTFSTFSFETMILLEKNSFITAGLNILGNIFFGLSAVMIGILTARNLF